MKKTLLIVIMFSIFALSTIQPSLAGDYKHINVDQLKEIESQDSFKVKVTKKQIKIDGVTSSLSRTLEGSDLFSLTLENSDDKDIKDFTVYAVAYDTENNPVNLGILKASYPYIQVLTNLEYSNKEYCIAANSSETFNMGCYGKEVAGIRAIVASYVTTDEEEHINPLAEAWSDNVTGSKIEKLD